MKKFIFTMFGIFILAGISAQSLTDWTNQNPGNVTISQESSNVNEGNYAMRIVSTTQDQGNTEIHSASFSVTPGASYTASINVFDNDTAGRARINIEFDDGTTDYGSYSNSAGTWEHVEKTGNVPSGATTAYVFFRFYDNPSSWNGDFECIIDSAVFKEGSGSNLLTNPGFENWQTQTPTSYNIPQIQDTTGSGSDASAVEGDLVETSGIVTAVYSSDFVIQDNNGKWSGIWVQGTGVTLEDSVTVRGTVLESNNLTTIASDSIKINSTNNTLPTPETLQTGNISEEGWEGVLIETTGTCTNDSVTSNYGEWKIDDGSGDVIIDDYGLSSMYNPTMGNNYTVTSPLIYSYGNFKLALRNTNDIIENVGNNPYLSITNPSDGATINNTSVDIEFNVQNFTIGNGTGYDGYIKYYLDGGSAQNYYNTTPITLTGLSETIHNIKLELVDTVGQPLNPEVKDSIEFTVDMQTSNLTAIYDIQYTTDSSGDSPLKDQNVTTAGIVTAKDGDKFWLQDSAGAWNGIYVYYTQTPSPAIGDSVNVEGKVIEYNNLTEISPVNNLTIISSNNNLPGPAQPSTNAAGTEAYEGVYVQVQGTNNNPPNQYNEWDVNDGSGAVMIDDLLYAYTPTQGNEYQVTGVVDYYFNFKILPRDSSDVVDLGVNTNPSIAITSPSNGDDIYTSAVDIEFNASNFVIGTDGKIAYDLDGGSVQYHNSTNPITISGLTTGSHTVNLELVDTANNSLNPQATASVTFNVDLSGPSLTSIYDIQYTTDSASPMQGQDVNVKGVVSASFNDSQYGEGYYLQQDSGAWNSVFVYDLNNTPDIGDSVLVSATVDEYNGFTELKNITSYTKVAIGGTVANPVVISTSDASDMEKYESVLVKVENAECTEAQGQYGEWKVNDGSGELILKDDGVFSFTEQVGTFYDVIGVLKYDGYDFRNELHYRIQSDIQVSSGINDNFISNLNIYPNPAINTINLENISEVNNIEIYSIAGKLLDKYNAEGNKMKINVSKYSKGMYLFKFSSDKINSTVIIEKAE